MAVISPSILSADFVNLERDIRAIRASGADWVHIDVMDGQFVPNITIGLPVVKAIRRVTDLPLDIHLMIDRPIRYADLFCEFGADYLTVHLEADTEENIRKTLLDIRARGVHPSIALKPGTPAEAAKPFLALCDMILVMTVEPGFGGQKFMTPMMEKLKTLRAQLDEVNPACILEVDGGVDFDTCLVCRDAGAEALVTGSAYFKAADKAAFVRHVQGK